MRFLRRWLFGHFSYSLSCFWHPLCSAFYTPGSIIMAQAGTMLLRRNPIVFHLMEPYLARQAMCLRTVTATEIMIVKAGTTFQVKNKESGLKWDCMEFARRYWMLRGTPVRATFDSVVGAADIWALNFVRLLDGSKTPLLKYPNGLPRRDGGSAPRAGDLLIYPASAE
ncbi:putative cysteine peptidase, Clan CA, family C51 [Trypanosoma cruzi]|uniref:Putative cysteine peptidase, Clan CA, family C51 n=1 Tax=Trypanosoma cruzi TaxID=5693 RepID=A0A2V2URU0_TRYCR|nr:putative cysteine peptidase, Clan CA, family C51 [Trypanosoma cruzi]